VNLLWPVPVVVVVASGLASQPDPIGDGWGLLLSPFFVCALTLTPLAIFLFFATPERPTHRMEIELALLEGLFYGAFVVAWLTLIWFSIPYLLSAFVFALPPVLSLMSGKYLGRHSPTPTTVVLSG
jgi:hypothetical protein